MYHIGAILLHNRDAEMPKQNWFNTLNETLHAEGLIETWDCFMTPIAYGETRGYTHDDGTRYGHYISIYRSDTGMYERPVHYPRG